MADLIEFPAHKVQPDSLPQPGDRYQAYGRAEKSPPASLTLVFPDWSMTSLPYDRRGEGRFRFLGEALGGDGEGVFSVLFEQGRGGAVGVAITGRKLYQAGDLVARQRMRWFWERPPGRAVPDGSPVVRTIAIKQGDARSIYDWLFQD